MAQPATAGIRFGRYRTVAFDGCTSIKVPDTARNRAWLGKMKASLGVTGYPAVELMTLAETGTRALLGAVFGPPATGETDYARKLLHLLDDTMLVLMDRGFDGAAFLAAVSATRAAFLVRLTAARRPPVMARLDDGSFLSLHRGPGRADHRAHTSPSPARTAPATPAVTGWRPPCSTTAAIPPRR